MAGYTLGDVLNNVLAALQDIMYYITAAIAQNAQVVATALVVGALVVAFWRYGGRIFRGITGWLRGLF